VSEADNQDKFPPTALKAGIAVVLFSIVAAALGSAIGGGSSESIAAGTALQSRDLIFLDQGDGSLAVISVKEDAVIHIVEPGTGGFIRGVLRGLGRERKMRGIGPDAIFTVTRWENGRLTVRDTASDYLIPLESFGPDNVEAFAILLVATPLVSGEETFASEAIEASSQVSL